MVVPLKKQMHKTTAVDLRLRNEGRDEEGDINSRLEFAKKMRKTPSEPGRYGEKMYLLTMFVYLDCYINESIPLK
ncbi:hypothetical protein WR25_07658 [Diploscapter pachys]|uniref:Uncharacterized protein n=1 Tax=Diploscapter pachys TaxID=2018661 RepID=A0A2A2LVN3_9BILA|nr:hypothetical protein WR25_07658 [Diploscapter pachys]